MSVVKNAWKWPVVNARGRREYKELAARARFLIDGRQEVSV